MRCNRDKNRCLFLFNILGIMLDYHNNHQRSHMKLTKLFNQKPTQKWTTETLILTLKLPKDKSGKLKPIWDSPKRFKLLQQRKKITQLQGYPFGENTWRVYRKKLRHERDQDGYSRRRWHRKRTWKPCQDAWAWRSPSAESWNCKSWTQHAPPPFLPLSLTRRWLLQMNAESYSFGCARYNPRFALAALCSRGLVQPGLRFSTSLTILRGLLIWGYVGNELSLEFYWFAL